jgi:C-terminal processing protease CtpA/Prc
MYAVNKLENVDNDEALGIELQKLFSPICPNVRFSKDSMVASASMMELPYYIMEHKGIGTLAAMDQGKDYTPIRRVGRNEDSLPSYKDMYNFRLKGDLYISFPMAIKQLPIKTKSFVELNSAIHKIKLKGLKFKKEKNPSYFFMNPDFRIADIIIRRNIIQHFYPYYKEDHLDALWDEACQKTIQEVSLCQSMRRYYDEICQLMSHVKDSHIMVHPDFVVKRIGGYIPTYYPDINIGFAGDTCYVKRYGKDISGLNKGDIIKAVNKIPIKEYCDQRLGYCSFSTKSSGIGKLTNGKLLESYIKDTTMTLTVENSVGATNDVQIKTTLSDNPGTASCFEKELDGNLLYINLCTDSSNYENFTKLIPDIQQSKGIILDVRGYPHLDEALAIISHFLKENIDIGNLVEPIIRFPNHVNIEYKQSLKWYVAPAKSVQTDDGLKKFKIIPVSINIPVVFLTNAEAMSFAESFLDMLKHYKVGTIIGEPTAGCNGDLTTNTMLFSSFTMSYNKFLNRDGSQHHGVGVLPDIYCTPTLSDIREGKDTQLERAKNYLYEMESTHP